MKTIALSLIVLAAYLLDSESDIKSTESALKGVWIYSTREKIEDKNVLVYKRVSSFRADHGGMAFKKNGELTIRQNVGWCGTPPISYGNYPGTWKLTDDKRLSLHHQYWGGWTDIEYEVVSATKGTLKLNYIGHKMQPKEK